MSVQVSLRHDSELEIDGGLLCTMIARAQVPMRVSWLRVDDARGFKLLRMYVGVCVVAPIDFSKFEGRGAACDLGQAALLWPGLDVMLEIENTSTCARRFVCEWSGIQIDRADIGELARRQESAATMPVRTVESHGSRLHAVPEFQRPELPNFGWDPYVGESCSTPRKK